MPTRFEITARAFREQQEEAYWLGFEHGEFGIRTVLRGEIRAELQAELEGFDPGCALCVVTRENKDLRKTFAAADIDRREARAQVRSWAIRSGAREYRETR